MMTQITSLMRVSKHLASILMLLLIATPALAAREARPEDIEYWHTQGPWVIFELCVGGAIFMLIIIWWVSRNRKK